jgi:hypothetical protein
MDIDLPSFQHATSIKLDAVHMLLELPAETRFPALRTLSLSGCFIQVAALIPRCPLLQELRIKLPSHEMDYITVHSPTLQELVARLKPLAGSTLSAPSSSSWLCPSTIEGYRSSA